MGEWEGIKIEAKRQMSLALPLTVANFLIFVLQFISLIFVGHKDKEKLAGASIAISFVNSVGSSVVMGVSLALDTLCGQAYGAKQYNAVGIQLQRSMVIVVLVSIPLSIIIAFSGQILMVFRQDPDISMEAQSYARLMIPSLFTFGLLLCLMRFLQAQNIAVPIMLSSELTVLFHCINSWVFIYKTPLGYHGAALSVSVSYFFNLLLLALYICLSPSCKSTWIGFSYDAFRNLWDFLRLGIPSAFMVCLQNWQFELLLIFSGLLSNPKVQTSVMSISQNTSSLVYMIPMGVSAAVSTRIANELGARNPRAAKLAILTATSTTITEGLLVGSALVAGRSIWGHAYSDDITIVKAVAQMMPYITLSHCMDGLQCVLLGIVRGCGRQKIGAFICLCSYYIIGIPASIILGFVLHMGVKGLWIGNICAIFVQDLALLIFSIFTNWNKQVLMANQRIQSAVKLIDMESSHHDLSYDINASTNFLSI